MEWIFWIGILLYLIIGEFCSRRYEYLKKKQFLQKTLSARYGVFMSPKEKNIILIKRLLIFFFWPLFLIYISIGSFLNKEVI